MIGFHKHVNDSTIIEEKQENDNTVDLENRYERRTRKIIHSRAFKRFIIALGACNLYKRIRDDRESLISELRYQMRGVKLDFKTGYANEIDDDTQDTEIPQLILAKDLYYFQNVNTVRATDVLVCNLPPWYEEVDLYKIVLPIVPNDFLGLEWFRMYAAGTKECSFPYAIVYLKTHNSACTLRYCTDGLVIDYRKISVCLMEDVEAMLLELKRGKKF
ncbi:hypothetical protein O3M35_007203 [Rhynocoris fuscipes]|uniref:Uncharacterized protein n=1 Tax=Rhynocoris fuscipes TaxID=488301 RepID=A0AAW1D8J0_9HEMI